MVDDDCAVRETRGIGQVLLLGLVGGGQSIYNSRSPRACILTHAAANYKQPKSFKIKLRISKTPAIQPTSFGQFLKKLRTEKQFSQRELARLAKVSHDSIRNWEKERFFPKKESLARLAKVFQVEETTLIEHQQN